MRTPQLVQEIGRAFFVAVNTIVCGFLLCAGALGLSGRAADAGVWQNEGYGVLFLLGALVAGLNLLAFLPDYHKLRSLRWSAYTANAAVVAVGVYMLWGGSVYGAIGGFSPESLLCWAFGLANIVAIAVTGD